MVDAIRWALFRIGIFFQIHYLDDYLFFSSPTSDNATSVLSQVMNTLNSMEVPVAFSKTEGPATVVTFLGIVVDTVRFELQLLEEKLSYIRRLTSGGKAELYLQADHRMAGQAFW